MNVQISGTFIQNGYYGLSDSQTRQSLNDMLQRAFPTGAVVKLTMTVAYAGTRPLCEAKNKYGACGTVLNEDGSCPTQSQHVEPEPEPEPEDSEAVTA